MSKKGLNICIITEAICKTRELANSYLMSKHYIYNMSNGFFTIFISIKNIMESV